MIHRRALLAAGLAMTAAPALAQSGAGDAQVGATGRFKARPGQPTQPPLPPGLHTLGLDRRDAHLFVPEGLSPTTPAPLIVMFHGKGQLAHETLGEWRRTAARNKVLVMAPQSRGMTWVVDNGPIGPDAQFIDRALAAVFDRFAVNPARIAAAGFSDGGTMALSSGMVNGDLFSHILTFAPIRFNAPGFVGQPKIFISNGESDPGASYANARAMARQLQGDGYDVEFHGFKGGHHIDEDAVKRAMRRFLGS